MKKRFIISLCLSLMAFFATPAFAQDETVTGTVLDELGEPFFHMISAGLTTKEAYYATLAMKSKEKVFAPDPIGRVSDNRVERDYYTSEELDNLTDEEMDANWDKVMRSMDLLSKNK